MNSTKQATSQGTYLSEKSIPLNKNISDKKESWIPQTSMTKQYYLQ